MLRKRQIYKETKIDININLNIMKSLINPIARPSLNQSFGMLLRNTPKVIPKAKSNLLEVHDIVAKVSSLEDIPRDLVSLKF